MHFRLDVLPQRDLENISHCCRRSDGNFLTNVRLRLDDSDMKRIYDAQRKKRNETRYNSLSFVSFLCSPLVDRVLTQMMWLIRQFDSTWICPINIYLNRVSTFLVARWVVDGPLASDKRQIILDSSSKAGEPEWRVTTIILMFCGTIRWKLLEIFSWDLSIAFSWKFLFSCRKKVQKLAEWWTVAAASRS